jgi:hypothetical protein
MLRLVLLVLVVALGADALLYSGAYTQAAWNEIAVHVDGIGPTDGSQRATPTSPGG